MTERKFVPLPLGVAFEKVDGDDYLNSLERLIDDGLVDAMVNIAVVKGPAPGTYYVRTWAEGVTLGETRKVLEIALGAAKEVAP